MVECIVCGADLNPPEDPVVGELFSCAECGVELEVMAIHPFAMTEAPQEEEDWGE